MSQFNVPGPAQVWVGTGGVLPTRIVFAGGGPNCTGANAIVDAIDDKGGINSWSMTDRGKRFTKTPDALAVGGGWGFCRRGTVVGGSVTTAERTPDIPASLTINSGKGYSYRMSDDFEFEFVGWTEGPVSFDVSSPLLPYASNATGDMASERMLQALDGRVGLRLARYNQDVLERMYSRCFGDACGSYPGITDGGAAAGIGAGSIVQAQFRFFPLVILAPYASTPPKRFFYGDTDANGNARVGIPRGVHFPVATIESYSEPFSWRARRPTINVVCHWVSDSITKAGLLYDFAVDCIGNKTPN